MSAARNISRYTAALMAAGVLLVASSVLTTPAFAQHQRGVPPRISHFNLMPSLQLRQNVWLRDCNKDDKSQVAACTNNLFPTALGGPDTKRVRKNH